MQKMVVKRSANMYRRKRGMTHSLGACEGPCAPSVIPHVMVTQPIHMWETQEPAPYCP